VFATVAVVSLAAEMPEASVGRGDRSGHRRVSDGRRSPEELGLVPRESVADEPDWVIVAGLTEVPGRRLR
jgi:hypothetical protein